MPERLVHYRNRAGSLSNVHSMKSLVDYWLVYRERFEVLGPMCDEYYRLSLAACLEAISALGAGVPAARVMNGKGPDSSWTTCSGLPRSIAARSCEIPRTPPTCGWRVCMRRAAIRCS